MSQLQTTLSPIVTLCGSKKFIEEFKQVELSLTLKGYTVLSPAIFNHPTDMELTKENITNYHKIHDQKILISDIVVIIAIDNYIGQDTKREIVFAESYDKPILYVRSGDDIENNLSQFYNSLKFQASKLRCWI